MAEIIKTYGVRTMEYTKLNLVAKMMNDIAFENKKPFFYDVQDTYFDYGQDWKWTTIIRENFDTERDVQLLYPNEYEKILNTDSIEELRKIAEEIFNR